MDVPNLNLVQSSVAAAAGIAADAVPADDAAAGIDFSALLALGLNSCAQDAREPQGQEDIKAETAIVAAGHALPASELLIALPQQLPTAEAPAGSTMTASDAPQADAPAAQTTKAAQIAVPAGTAADTRAAAVADETANIAASSAQTAQATQSQQQTQNVDQRIELGVDPQFRQDFALESQRTNSSDAPSRSDPLHHAFQIHPAETRAPRSEPSALLEVQAPVSEPGFAQALSRQVVWMVDKDAQIAELRINPPELGPVEVRLTLTQDSAAAEFVSPHAEVRAAIENAIVRLREAMAEAGIQLGETSVSAEPFSRRNDAQADSRQARDGYRDAPFAGDTAVRSNASAVTVRRGLVDVFA